MTTPTPEALARAKVIIGPCEFPQHYHPEEWCTACRAYAENMNIRIALALDAERQAVWEAAISIAQEHRCQKSYGLCDCRGDIARALSNAAQATP